jgi:hypothetical protein
MEGAPEGGAPSQPISRLRSRRGIFGFVGKVVGAFAILVSAVALYTVAVYPTASIGGQYFNALVWILVLGVGVALVVWG